MADDRLNTWDDHVRQVCDLQAETLATGAEFLANLNQLIQHPDSPLIAVSMEIDRHLPFEGTTFGPVALRPIGDLGEPADSSTYLLDDQSGTQCRVKLWRDSAQQSANWDTSRLVHSLRTLLASFWRPDLRDAKSRIISLQHRATEACVDATLQRIIDTYGRVAVVFCDLDKFKDVNDKISELKGDEVILHFSSLFERIASPSAIPIHRGGDEFIILYPGAYPDDSLMLARSLMTTVAAYNFNVGDIPVGVSAGIALISKGDGRLVYKEAEHLAEKTLKLEGGTKLRGKARIRSTTSGGSVPGASEHSQRLASCLVKGDPACERPFGSPWLNLVSRVACAVCRETAFDCERIAAELDGLFRWVLPEYDAGTARAAVPSIARDDWEPRLASEDLAFAAAHGLFRAGLFLASEILVGKSLQVEYATTNGGACRLRLMPEGQELMRIGDQNQEFVHRDLGGFLSFGTADRVDPRAARRALLIKIGHAQPSLPDTIFSDVLVVDDRPTRGGMLPDFWESAVARVASRMAANPNITWVYVLGNPEYAEETVGRLRNLDRWTDEAEHFSYKTGMSIATIKDAAERLRDKVAFVTSNDDLVNRFAHDLLSAATVPPLQPRTEGPASTRFLDRELRMEHLSLKIADGCRVATIAEAFPVVLEIARKMPRDQTIRDQAGQELVELIDFRVHLTNPLADRVPAFYAKEDASLEQYLHRAFLDAESFFGARIGETQRQAVLEHVVMAIRDPAHQFATRRAVLVVPHEIRPGEEITPLGLIAVRIIPRFQGRRIVLHFSFTWRTVEALVGFPYSLYGSVGYADHLTSTIRQMIGEPTARHVEFGEVSYIANSLHMFMDDYGQNIARRIVDDASL